jgi:hypothetical protein
MGSLIRFTLIIVIIIIIIIIISVPIYLLSTSI